MSNNEKIKKDRKDYYKILIGGIFTYIFFVGVLFLLAWRLDYWQAWAYGATGIVMILAAGIAFRNRPELIKERVKPGPGTKKWDKVLWAFFAPMMFAVMIVAALDGGRFGWTSDLLTPGLLLPVYKFFGWMTDLPWYLYVIGYGLFYCAQLIKYWCMWSNRFFSSTVRIQFDRDHEVVQSGPYRFIRHPGYISGIFIGFGSSLVLGSLWGLIPSTLVLILLVIRTHLEDKTLQKELPGYADYAKKVKYRLLPPIW